MARLFTRGPGHAWATWGPPEHARARTLEPRVLRGLERVLAATVSPQEAALTFDVVILSQRHQSRLSAHWRGSDSRWPSAPRTIRTRRSDLIRARESFSRDGGNFPGRLNQPRSAHTITSRSLKSRSRRCFSRNRAAAATGSDRSSAFPSALKQPRTLGCAASALNNSATGSWVMKGRRGLNRIPSSAVAALTVASIALA